MMRNEKKKMLDALLTEARRDWVPGERGEEGDFSAVDAKLFERIAREPLRPVPASFSFGSMRLWGGVAFACAAAAAIFTFGRAHGPDQHDVVARNAEQGGSQAEQPESASTGAPRMRIQAAAMLERQGHGEVRIAGSLAEPGHELAVSDTLETTDARGVFASGHAQNAPEGEARPAVTWLIEEHSHLAVDNAQFPLVLSLADGAVEAQVAPVDHGEAFAVDVDGVRVAVHGTHLRVWRNGGHVTIDLSEGVVAVGAIPKSGLTEGNVITAPAHVELDTDDVVGTIRVSSAASSVRTPVQLGGGSRPSAARDGSAQVDRPARQQASASNTPAATERPEQAITNGVRACVASQIHEATVRVTVSSKLSLKVAADGSVYFARFNPPLSPGAQECASRVIYKTRFTHGGDVEIPLSTE